MCIRDRREEAGLLVVPESIRECGKVIEKRRDIFEADKIYYCHTYVYSVSYTHLDVYKRQG